jgi:Tol biopolymer transport system component/DNA-binding winged helix-turn-helix (wHTH) protein
VDVTYRFSGFSVDPVRRLLFGPNGQPIALTPRVFETLLYFLEHRGELLKKQALLDAVWPHVIVEENNLNQAISTLRRILGETRDDHRFIVTEPGRGYRFVARVEAIPAEPPAPSANVSSPPAEPAGWQSNSRELGVAASLKRSSGPLLLGSLVLAISALFLAAWPRIGPAPEAGSTSLATAVRVTRITAYVGNELAPALSPTGESVVFSRDDETGNRDLFVMRIGSTGSTRLTDAAEPDRFPAWSPDASNIAFLRQRGPTSFKLLVVPAGGVGPERELATVSLRPTDIYGSPPLTWTPLSDGLVFTTRTGDAVTAAHHLYRLTLATGDLTQVTAGENVYDTSPAISPDGRWLAFVRHGDFLSHSRGVLMVQPLTTAEAAEPIVVPVPRTGAETLGDAVHSASWSADGRYLTFVAGVNLHEWEFGATETRHVWAGAGHLGEVTPAGDISALTMIRDGGRARAVVASIDRSLDIVALRLAPSTHEVSEPPVPRFVTTAVEAHPDFSHDGTRVAFISRRSTGPDVWIAAADGANAWRLTDRQARTAGFPRWSPDDRLIAFHDMREPATHNVYVVAPDTGVVQHLAPGCCAAWSASGEYLYVTDVGASHTLARIRVADGQREPLFTGAFAVVTADGSKLLYGKAGEHNLYSRAVAGDLRNNAEELLVTDSAYPSGAATVADGVFYFGYALPGEPATIRFYDYATRETRIVARVPGTPFEASTVSPDAAELLYGSQAATADLVLVEFGQPWR